MARLDVAIETCFAACSVSFRLEHGGQHSVFQKHNVIGRGHAECVIEMLRALAEDVGQPLSSAARIVATVGPGTFTGQRVGVAAAQGLAAASGAEVFGVSSLLAIAATARRRAAETDLRDEAAGIGEALAVVVDAGRKGLYWQTFPPSRRAGGTVLRLEPPRLLALADAIERARTFDGRICGNGVALLRQAGCAELRCFETDHGPTLAEARDLHELPAQFGLAPVAKLRPFYLREPVAATAKDHLARV